MMNRTILYILVAFLAFFVGVAVVFNFLKKNETLTAKAESANTENLHKIGNKDFEINSFEQNSVQEKFFCKDKLALQIWQILKKTDYMKGQSGSYIETGDCRQYLKITHRIDLNNDGQAELYVESGYRTSPASFQTAWIFAKKNGRYKAILSEERDDNFKILKTKTNGFYDLYFVSRRDVGTAFLSTYKYKNGAYESVKCSVAVYHAGKQVKWFGCGDNKGIEDFESQ